MDQTSAREPGSEPPPLLQQAPVGPLDASGFTASIVGTVLFTIATLVTMVGDQGGSWVYVFATGTVAGLILIAFTALHRRSRSRLEEPPS